MAETVITVKATLGSYPSLQPAANAADFTFGAIDLTLGGYWVTDETELLVVQNTDAGATTLTIKSVADSLGRSGDITAYSIGIGEFAVFGPFKRAGWADSEGKIHITVSDVDLKVAVIRPTR